MLSLTSNDPRKFLSFRMTTIVMSAVESIVMRTVMTVMGIAVTVMRMVMTMVVEAMMREVMMSHLAGMCLHA